MDGTTVSRLPVLGKIALSLFLQLQEMCADPASVVAPVTQLGTAGVEDVAIEPRERL